MSCEHNGRLSFPMYYYGSLLIPGKCNHVENSKTANLEEYGGHSGLALASLCLHCLVLGAIMRAKCAGYLQISLRTTGSDVARNSMQPGMSVHHLVGVVC